MPRRHPPPEPPPALPLTVLLALPAYALLIVQAVASFAWRNWFGLAVIIALFAF